MRPVSRGVRRVAVGLFVMFALFAVGVPAAGAAAPPHLAETSSTDSCAMCHRAHTATTIVPFRAFDSTSTTGTSLIIAPDSSRFDVSLCFQCHGIGQLGSNLDVETTFSLASTHSIAPVRSPYGPDPKYCSSCHDSHGSARTASGTPYPGLLRSFDGTSPVYNGEEYCATCHPSRRLERWDGLSVYRGTAHYSGLPVPASGTGIRCAICHDPHGSSVAPILVGTVMPPAAPATVTITANDRTFCQACHPSASASWPGTATYRASSHALSTATVPVSAYWATGTVRAVGECQVCHAAMGRSDGSTGTIPKLAEKAGRALCDDCHAPGASASKDTSTLAYPSAEATAPELAAVYAPSAATSWAARAALYSRDTTGAAPRKILGPREYGIPGASGPAAAGPLLIDSADELVVADSASASLTVFGADLLTGLERQPSVATIPAGAPARAIVIANVIANGVGWLDRPEIVIVTSAGDLVLYRWTGSVLTTIAGPVAVGAGPWGLAAGDVTGTTHADVVVTDRSGGNLYVFTDVAGTLTGSPVAAGADPVAPSVGDVWNATTGNEIVVAHATGANTLSVFDGAGANLGDYVVAAGAGVPVATAVGDVLPGAGFAGAEVAVAFVDAGLDSTLVIVPQAVPGPGLSTAAAQQYGTGAGANGGSVLVGDIDADGRAETVVGRGGTWARGAAAVAPGLLVHRPDAPGTALTAPATALRAGGVELAGAAPSLALADFGPVLPSRHPVDEAPVTHVSTETAPFGRHVACPDCHNTHEATTAVAAAPAVQGKLAGAWGVAVTNATGSVTYAAPARAATSYAVCLKCHSSYVPLAGRSDIASATNPTNPSVHAVQSPSADATARPETFVGSWGNGSVMYCSDCHGNLGRSGSQARGGHRSDAAPILAKAYLGIAPDDSAALCFTCHRFGVFGDGSLDTTGASRFWKPTPLVRGELHAYHVSAPSATGLGFGCSTCHVSHGSATEPHLMRSDIGYAHVSAGGGACANACHTGGVSRAYP